MRVIDFYGREINYAGIGFEGSPRTIFWSRYIEPFMEDIAFRTVDHAIHVCQERGLEPRRALIETQGLLNSYTRRAFERMAEIDQRLRGKGFPDRVSRRSVDREQQVIERFINSRISAELSLSQASPSRWKAMNTWFREHPLLGFSVGTAIALAGLLLKLLGAW